ncbi:MAG: hypothetical protein ACI9O4_001553 [Chitinophagales bacterium]|jgi:hypothetical protein
MAVVNFKNIRLNNEQFAWFLFDLFMVTLAILNINLIIFDFTFSYNLGSLFYHKIAPKLANWYGTNIHEHFILIDLAFVAFFALEFVLRWIVSIYKKEYHRWFFFPFARWYDLLGLIPIGSFRFLRVLRIISIVIRLQKMKVLNLQESSLYPGFKKYTSVLVEEVSDRVVLNVLDGVQYELDNESNFTKEVVEKIIRPNNERIINFTMKRIQLITQQVLRNHDEDIKNYLFEKVSNAVEVNSEMKMIKSVPGIGGIIRKQLDHAIADITYKVVSGIIEDVSNGQDVVTQEIEGISEQVLLTLESDEELEDIVKTISSQAIILLKKQVERQNWKENEFND